jgi:phage tail sheath protein FI
MAEWRYHPGFELRTVGRPIARPRPGGVLALELANIVRLPSGGRRLLVSATREQMAYVNVRRLLIFIETSLAANLAWAAFEPNAPPLWAAVTRNVEAFLQTLFLQGDFAGARPEQAYFVTCGPQTMTEQDLADGVLNVLVGVAPVFPAEFIILRISQLTGSAS